MDTATTEAGQDPDMFIMIVWFRSEQVPYSGETMADARRAEIILQGLSSNVSTYSASAYSYCDLDKIARTARDR